MRRVLAILESSLGTAHPRSAKYRQNLETLLDQIAHFFDARAFGRIAGWHQDLSTGEPVLITGRLQQDTWQDKTSGQNRQRVVIIADEIRRLARRGDTASAPAPSTTTHTMMKPDTGEDVSF